MAQILTFRDGIRIGVVMGVSLVVSTATEQSLTTSTTANVPEHNVNPHPITSLLGKYRDEPLWDGFEEALRLIREEEAAT